MEQSRDKFRLKYRRTNGFIDKMLEVPQTMPDKFMREIDKKFHFKMHDICSIDSEQRKDFQLREMRQKQAQELDPNLETYEIFKPIFEKHKKDKSKKKNSLNTNRSYSKQDQNFPSIAYPIVEEYTQTQNT